MPVADDVLKPSIPVILAVLVIVPVDDPPAIFAYSCSVTLCGVNLVVSTSTHKGSWS